MCISCMLVKSGKKDIHDIPLMAMINMKGVFSVEDNDFWDSYTGKDPKITSDDLFHVGKKFQNEVKEQWFQVEMDKEYMFHKFILKKRGQYFSNYGSRVIKCIRFAQSVDGSNWTYYDELFKTG